MRKPAAGASLAACWLLALALVPAHGRPAPARPGAAAGGEARDLGFVRLRRIPGLRAEVAFRDAIGAGLGPGPRPPRRAVAVRIGFERGAGACTRIECGDARATASVRWPPGLPFLFAVEAGPGVPPPATGRRGRGPGDFAGVPRSPGLFVSSPRKLPLPGGRRASVDCAGPGTCVARIPIWPGVRAWFLCDAPATCGGEALAVDAFARDALLPAAPKASRESSRGAKPHY